jgi:choline dehydrogenase-like flavoprotein
MRTPVSTRLTHAAQDLGFAWHRLDKFMDQDAWRPEFKFGYYGDPHRIKWSARMYVEDAISGGATLIDRAKVKKVIVENGKAVGVEYSKARKTYTASADNIVLAAGGIGTPVILRNSGIHEAGYNFFSDPLITVCGTLKDIQTQANEIPMSAGVHMESEGYLMTDMHVPPLTHMAFSAQVLRMDKLFAFRHTVRIMVKVKDTLSGHLTDKGGVRKKLATEDREKLLHGYMNAKNILEAAGAKNIYKTWYFAAHPGGTAKIGEIVDSSLKTKYDNLYVCDCSVIPEAWGLPPTMAILALGRYLARNLLSISSKDRNANILKVPDTQSTP